MVTFLTPEERVLAEKFAYDRREFVMQGLNPAVAALRANDLDRVNKILVEFIRPLYKPVGEGIHQLGKFQLDMASREYEETQYRYEIVFKWLVVISVIGVGSALWIFYVLSRSISNSLHDVVKIANSVAAGDLSQQIVVRSTNEIGQLMSALKRVHDYLIQIISQIRDSEVRARAVLDNVDQGIIVFNVNGEI